MIIIDIQKLFFLVAFIGLIASCAHEKIVNPKIPEVPFVEGQTQEILEQLNLLNDEERSCKNKFVKSYQDSLYEYCLKTDGGRNIGGGCAHEAYGWSITNSVLLKALKMCKAGT